VYFKNYIPKQVGTNKLMKATQQITKLSQVEFLLGRNNIEGTIFLYEIIHTKYKLVFRIDIEVYVNSYTTSSKMKGVLSYFWCEWVKSFVQGDNVGIKEEWFIAIVSSEQESPKTR